MKSRWLGYRLNTLILIILIQQPEPSGGEARETRERNRIREIFFRQGIAFMLCRGLLRAVYLRHGTGGFTSPLKEVRATDFYHP
jgi:hypothetical protein